MKKKVLIASLILAVALSILFAFTLDVGAEEAEPTLSIGGKALVMESSVNIRYLVNAQNVASMDDVKVLVWNAPQESYVKGTEIAEVSVVANEDNTTTNESTGVTYYHYEFTGVAAKMLADDFYAVAYVKVGDKEYYSAPDKYSVLKYSYNKMGKLDKAATTDKNLIPMLETMLDYGATAQDYFKYKTDRPANADFYQVKTVGGTLSDGFTDGLYLQGDLVTITAGAPAEGYYFSGWKKNSTDEIVSTAKTATVEVGTENETYTAVYDNCSVGLEYTLSADGTYYNLSGIGSCTDSVIHIPYSYKGIPVKRIEDRAFENCNTITEVVITDIIIRIGYYAFQNCTTLERINISNSVGVIGSRAFNGCTKLESVTIPDSVTSIGTYAFYGCTSLVSVSIGKGVTQILNNSFDECTSLEYVDLSKNEKLTFIGNSAFDHCAIREIVIPNNFTTLGAYAFSYCRYLESITIPSSLTECGNGAFSGCSKLETVNYLGTVEDWCNIKFSSINDFNHRFSNPLSLADNLCINGETVTELIIPDGVTSIGNFAFDSYSSLEKVYIPKSVTSIGNYAFNTNQSITVFCEAENQPDGWITNWCSGNNEIYWGFSGSGTTDSGFNWFATKDGVVISGYTGSEANVSIPEIINKKSVVAICSNAFSDNTNIISIVIPNSVTSIGDSAFRGCTSLTSVTIPDGVTSIGNSAFRSCTSLISVTIGNNVTSIGSYAFFDCTNLTSVYITDIAAWCSISFTGFNSNPLYYANNLYLNGELVKELIIPDSVTEIGAYAFYKCSSLISVTIGNNVTSIGDSAFYNCLRLTSVTIPDSVTEIGAYAFEHCSSLTSVTIGNGVTEIGFNAFFDCTNLTSVYITDIAAWCSISFTGFNSNPLYYANNLYLNGELVKELIIPDSVTSIGAYAFYNCSSLASVTIPDSVTEIGDSAFALCSRLTSITVSENNTVYKDIDGNLYTKDGKTLIQYAIEKTDTNFTIPDSVTSIGAYAFRGCSSLESVTIPDSVTEIGSSAFHNCSSLISVTIGNNVTSIGAYAFYYCKSLTSINYCGTEEQWNSITKGSNWNSNTGHYTIVYNYTEE